MVQKRYPSSELLAAGWSLGANILVRYLGEEGPNCIISAAASLCNPLDLVSNPCGFLKGNGMHAGSCDLTIYAASSHPHNLQQHTSYMLMTRIHP